ncbi:MAG: beta-propeller domain-containing protein [Verrucomicrobiia bacterium]
MKTTLLRRFLLQSMFIGLAWWIQASAAHVTASPVTEPAITSIRFDGKDVVVTAHVPAGLTKVTLQSCRQLGTGAWEPRAVARLDGEGGEVTFRIPSSPEAEILRVRADDSEPLPTLFYQGINEFPGVPVQQSNYPPGAYYRNGDALDGGPVPAEGDGQRTVVESDIWKVEGDTLYFFNQFRGLQVIDVAIPDAPVVRGTLSLPASGEQMYVLGKDQVVLLARQGCGWSPSSSSRVLIVDAAGATPSIIAELPLDGETKESRLVGTALYVMAQMYRPVADSKDNAWEWGTAVYAFDLANPAAPVARPSLWFAGYGNVMAATDAFLFVGVGAHSEGAQIFCIDISAPDGTLGKATTVKVAGRVPDKFKMHLNNDVFTVISEAWRLDDTGRSRPLTKLETFSLADPAAPQKLGELELADGEQLHATRFDGDRVYVVTFFRIDPLWVVDLSDPTRPAITGELHVPGWSTYIQPYGDRLVTIGIDDTNGWRVAVSLFDVQDPAAPTLLSKVPLGENSSWSEANSDEKAFGFLPDAGLILVPYSTYSTTSERGVQLIDFSPDALVKRGVISHNLEARRSTLHRDRILSISGRELLTVDAANRDKPEVRSELELAWPVNRVFVQDAFLLEVEDAQGWDGVVNPVVRVVQANAPDRVLGTLTLTNLPVAGAALRDGRLYVLQATTTYVPVPVLVEGEEKPGTEGTNRTVLLCSVVDTTHLPALEVIGQAGFETGEIFGSSAQPVWPKADVLIWVSQGSNWGPWLYADALVWRGGGRWYPWYQSGEARLYSVDASNAAAPRFLSEVTLGGGTNRWGGFSEPFTADGAVFLSEQFTEATITGTNIVVRTNVVSVGDEKVDPLPPDSIVTVTNTELVYTSRQVTWLHVVDYAAPATPVARQPITVPGELRGLSSNGALLYLVGYKLDTETLTDGQDWLHACSYDGVASYLVDSIPLSKEWPHDVLAQDRWVYITRPRTGDTVPAAMEVWTLNDSAKLARLSEQSLASNAYALHAISDLLVAEEEGGLEFFDLTQPSQLPRLGKGAVSGCSGFDVGAAAGSKKDGLWLPMDLYGVIQILPQP